MKTGLNILSVSAAMLLTAFAQAQQPRVAWYGQLKDGLEEAQRSNRPILLLSAAPQCEGVPGIW